MKLSFCLLLICPIFVFGQQSFITLFSSSHIEAEWGKPQKKVNTPLAITYSTNNCLITFNNKTVSFHNTMYRQDVEGTEIVESIMSGDGAGFNDGYYKIRIGRSKAGTNFQIALPDGFTYFAGHAEAYSENGRVTANVYSKNINDFKKMEVQDSIRRVELKRREDSIAEVTKYDKWTEFYNTTDSAKEPQKSIIKLLDPPYHLQKFDYHLFKKLHDDTYETWFAIKENTGNTIVHVVTLSTGKIITLNDYNTYIYPYMLK